MKITDKGLTIEDYQSANPNQYYSTFTDVDGARFSIKTTTLVKMYELVKFDLERRNGWNFVMDELEKEQIK